MGLSSSQARLLTLTSRMHDIEYKAAKLEAQKLQMANESRKAYDDYLVALDATKIQMKTINTDGSLNYVDATYRLLSENGYRLSNDGLVIISKSDLDLFQNDANNNIDKFAALKSGSVQKSGNFYTLTSDPSTYCAFDEADLRAISSKSKIILMNDITFNTTSSNLGNATSMNLNGNGHTIKITGESGLFNTITSCNIENLALDYNISGDGAKGGLAATSLGNTTIKNISAKGSIHSNNDDSGGIIGVVRDGANIEISNVSVDVIMSSNKTGTDHGAVIGFANNAGVITVRNADVNGKFETNQSGAGILAHINAGATLNVENCKINVDIHNVQNDVDVSFGSGIIAYIQGDTTLNVNNCYISGTIDTACIHTGTGAAYAGGISANVLPLNFSSNINNTYVDVNINRSNGSDALYAGDLIGGTGVNINMTNIGSSHPSDNIVGIGTVTNDKTKTDNEIRASVISATLGAGANLSSKSLSASYSNALEIGQAIASGQYIIMDGNEDNPEWLTNMLNNGNCILQKQSKDGSYYDVSVAVDTGLQEVSDEKDLRKAEAKYEADMKKIDMKDRRYDTQLAALDNERNAIKSEMETLKTVAKDNVERTFKLFS